MPLDRYLPPAGLKIDQLVAASYGHIRYETGVTKWYPPVTQLVASWQSTEILSDPQDFFTVVTGTYTEGLAPVTGTVATVSTDQFNIGVISVAATQRISFPVDLNGYASINQQDAFVATAGHHGMLGLAVRRRQLQYTSFNEGENTGSRSRQSSTVVSAMVFVNSGLVGLSSGVTATAASSSSFLPTLSGFFAGEPTAITFSAAQNAANALVVTVPFRSAASSANAPAYVLPWNPATSPDELMFAVARPVFRVSVLSAGQTVTSAFINISNIVTVGAGGFVGTIPASSIPTSGSYTVRVEEKRPATYSTVPSGYALDTYAVVCQGVSTVSVSTTITLTGLDTTTGGGGAVTGGGISSVSTVLVSTAVANLQSDWTVQDLQVNLRSRVVTSSLGTVRIKPGENAVLGIVFNNGSFVVDPGATAVRLAARGANNATPYYLYNTNTTIVSVSAANYYRMEVLANDEDLLAGQAASLLAGSNAAQSLVGEIQWVTTLGTFSSDTFTINAPNEVVREPDV